MSQDSPAELVGKAAAGDRIAWNALVDLYSGMLWSIAREYRLGEADAADAHQNTWLLLTENLGTLREPARVSAWLVTTARRECLRQLATHRRRPSRAVLAEPEDGPEQEVLRYARDAMLWRAVNSLPRRCRMLLRLVAYNPELTYEQLGGAIGLAPGSIGPTKTRCLTELRRRLAATGLTEETG